MPSTFIADMKYNEETQALEIRFVSGLIYEYQKVPPEVYDEMKKAFSKGNFLNQRIKGTYAFKKVDSHLQ